MRHPDDALPSDQDVQRVAGRDWEAFAREYDHHVGRLYRVARLLLPGQAALAEDCVAETFIKVHRAWMEGRVDNFFGYARQTLANHVLGLFRKQQTADRYLALVGPAPDMDGPAMDDAVVDAQSILDALGELPDRRRAAVVLRYYEDLSYGEIAELMGISIGAVKAHVFAALQQLRTRLTAVPP